MSQKVIVKKLLAHAGHDFPIKDGVCGEPGNIEIPKGWMVKQIATSSIEKSGDTKYIAVIMLLEEITK